MVREQVVLLPNNSKPESFYCFNQHICEIKNNRALQCCLQCSFGMNVSFFMSYWIHSSVCRNTKTHFLTQFSDAQLAVQLCLCLLFFFRNSDSAIYICSCHVLVLTLCCLCPKPLVYGGYKRWVSRSVLIVCVIKSNSVVWKMNENDEKLFFCGIWPWITFFWQSSFCWICEQFYFSTWGPAFT